MNKNQKVILLLLLIFLLILVGVVVLMLSFFHGMESNESGTAYIRSLSEMMICTL